MNNARQAVGIPTISPIEAVAEMACDDGKKALGFSSEQLIAACGLVLMGVVILAVSNYSLAIAKGDFRLDLRPRRYTHAKTITAVVGCSAGDARQRINARFK